MYEKPTIRRFGSFRDLTLQGCTGASDGVIVPGVGIGVGTTPAFTGSDPTYCFSPEVSR